MRIGFMINNVAADFVNGQEPTGNDMDDQLN